MNTDTLLWPDETNTIVSLMRLCNTLLIAVYLLELSCVYKSAEVSALLSIHTCKPTLVVSTIRDFTQTLINS